jgi:hypothetical protein
MDISKRHFVNYGRESYNGFILINQGPPEPSTSKSFSFMLIKRADGTHAVIAEQKPVDNHAGLIKRELKPGDELVGVGKLVITSHRDTTMSNIFIQQVDNTGFPAADIKLTWSCIFKHIEVGMCNVHPRNGEGTIPTDDLMRAATALIHRF